MILRNSITFLAASLSLATIAWADETTRFEMWEEPSHQQVFVDGPARILDIRIVPGLMSEFHKHRFATAYVVIQDALVASQLWDEEWSASGPRDFRKAGATVDNSGYVEKPFYHRVRNEDEKTFHLVAVINERSLSAAAPVNKVDETIIDNAWFREHRVQVGRGSSSDTLTFANDVALFQPGTGSSHVLENGIAHSFKAAPAAFSWHRAGSEFQIANSGEEDLEFEFVLIEVK
jgi:hypothetical protein